MVGHQKGLPVSLKLSCELSCELLAWLFVCSEVHIFTYGPADATAIPELHHLLPH